MRIISVKYLRDFWGRHPDAEQALKAWHEKPKRRPGKFRKTSRTGIARRASSGATGCLQHQQGLTVKDLEPFIGQLNRVYEVLARKRPLTLRMIRRIHEGLGIPAEVLIQENEGTALAA